MPTSDFGASSRRISDRAAVREEEVVRGRECIRVRLAARRVMPPAVPDPRDDPRLVVRDPVPDPVPEPAATASMYSQNASTVPRTGQPPRPRAPGACPSGTASRTASCRWRATRRRDGRRSRALPGSPARGPREDARPRDREAERVDAELAHQRDVFSIAVIEVARDGAVVAVPDLAGRRAEAVPDALAAAVLGAPRPPSGRRRWPRPRRSRRERASGGWAWSSSRSRRGAVTWQRATAARLGLDERRRHLRADVHGERTPRDEAAARHAGRPQPRRVPLRISIGSAPLRSPDPERRRAGAACTDAAARRAPRSTGPCSTIWPAYMTRMSSAT